MEDTASPLRSDTRIRFVLELGSALHRYGTPAHRLEDVMTVVAAQLGLEARFVSTPTAIYASFDPAEALHSTLIRVEPGDVDLDRLSRLDRVAGQVVARQLTPEQGAAAITEILASGPTWGPAVTIACFGFASAAGAQLFGGRLVELGVSLVIGLVLGVLAVLAGKVQTLARGFELVAAFTASALSVVGAHFVGGFSAEITTLAALVYLLPGLTLTVAMIELATRNLVSGTTRFTGALLVFLQLAFGVALGQRLRLVLPPASVALPQVPLPGWTTGLTLVVITLSLAVLFKARMRDAVWILAASILAWGGGRLGAVWLGPELGAFLGALALGVGSNVFSRLMDRPSLVTIVPGVMLLVPGSVGYRSLESMMAQDVVAGLATAFSMFVVLVGLSAGILLSNALVPPRRGLV